MKTKKAGRPPAPAVGNTFAARLRRRRLRSGRRAEDLAAEVGVSASSWWDWETGRWSPRLAALQKIAAALDCRVSDLL